MLSNSRTVDHRRDREGRMKSLILRVLLLAAFFVVSANCGSSDVVSSCEEHSHQGCCSSHGGVDTYDHTTCQIICADGTYSPTCYW